MSSDIEPKDILLLVVSLAGGWAGGYFTSKRFHDKQVIANEVTEENLYRMVEKTYFQSLKNGVNDAAIAHALRSAEQKALPLSDLVEIKARMDQIISVLEGSGDRSKLAPALVFEYKALGDRWSQLASVQLDLRIMAPNGQINLERFKAAHESIFPNDYPWAGQLRKENVYILDTMGTVVRIVELTEVQTTLETVPPEKIESNLRDLFGYWNSRANSLLGETSDTKISEISKFHHELEIIHPFMDGNGRMGRKLVEEQVGLLFGTQVRFRPDRIDYYRALRAMDFGGREPLEMLIKEALTEFNVKL